MQNIRVNFLVNRKTYYLKSFHQIITSSYLIPRRCLLVIFILKVNLLLATFGCLCWTLVIALPTMIFFFGELCYLDSIRPEVFAQGVVSNVSFIVIGCHVSKMVFPYLVCSDAWVGVLLGVLHKILWFDYFFLMITECTIKLK